VREREVAEMAEGSRGRRWCYWRRPLD
jgi:hypothetical protein